MGRLRPFPIVGGAYTDDALPWAHQDTVNYLPVRAEREGTRSPAKLAMPPGMRVVSDVGTGPHRGGRDVEGQSFVVSGTTLYKVASDGVTTSCGTIPGTGRVRMTHNQITAGNQVFIATGSSGYVYNTVTEALVQVTDDAFPGAKSCDFLGQYIIGVEPFGRYWFHSALADATSYNALDVFQAETQSDRIQGVIASHNELLVFGTRTIEPWPNSPTENAAFQLQVGSVVETGCASGDTLCRLDNSVYFLTDKGQVAKLEGYTPRIISTYAMEGAIKDCDLSRAFAFTWEDKGHTVYYITFPDGHTWGYDVRQNEWHRRESYGLDRWRLNTLFKSNGTWYGGDYQTGKLYRLDWDYALEGCDPIDRRRIAGYLHDNGEPVRVNAFQVLMDSGSEESVAHDGVTVSGAMPDGYVGDTVNYQYTITLAYPGQTYTLVAEGLPDGVTLSGTGLASGTFDANGTFSITITSTDDCGNVTEFVDSVAVGPFTIDGDVPDGQIGDSPSGSYTNTHGVEPISYEVTSGTFPDGLTLATDGTYSGTYTTEDTYLWTVTGTDSEGNTATVDDTAVVGAHYMLVSGQGVGPTSWPYAAYSKNPAAWTTIDESVMTTRSGMPAGSLFGWSVVARPSASHASAVDGSWSASTVPNEGASVNAAEYGHGTIMAGGSPGSGDALLYRSTDHGATFASVTNPFGGATTTAAFAYGSSRWLLAETANYGRIAYSDDDGATFTAMAGDFGSPNPWGSTSKYPASIEFGNDIFVAGIVGNGTEAGALWSSSTRGAAWTKLFEVATGVGVRLVEHGTGSNWIAVCSNGDVIATEDDWDSTTTYTDAVPDTPLCITFDGLRYVVGYIAGNVYYTTHADLDSWSGPVDPGVGAITGITSSYGT